MSAYWLNGAGLVCNIIGVVAIFFFGVPRYPSPVEAGHDRFVGEGENVGEQRRVQRAAWLSYAGLGCPRRRLRAPTHRARRVLTGG